MSRPNTIRHLTSLRATAADLENITAIADALRTTGAVPFATRAHAVRFALAAAADFSRRHGRLPSAPSFSV